MCQTWGAGPGKGRFGMDAVDVIGEPGYYDGPEHPDVQIRNECRGNDKCPGHVMRPFMYDVQRWPGNYGGVIIDCDGDLEETVRRALAFHEV